MDRRTLEATWIAGACAVALTLGVGTARADDGVTEINDASVTAAGGYPFTIGARGSYVLTSNLAPPVGVGALVVTAGGVHLDLNGFTLIGSGGGAGDGVLATGSPGFAVENGAVRGFAGSGIAGDAQMKVSKLVVMMNAAGIVGAGTCVIADSAVIFNSGVGISAASCTIENNIVNGNVGTGISGSKNVIVDNVILGNGAPLPGSGGIYSPDGSTIRGNLLETNRFFGISDTLGSPPGPVPAPAAPGVGWPAVPPAVAPNQITDNVVTGGPAGTGIGIFIAGSAVVTGNTVANWDIDGIVCSIACTVRGNQVHSTNTTGAGNGGMTIGPGSTISDNSVSFNTGVGLVTHPTARWADNALDANSAQDMSLVVPIGAPAAAAHPSSGFGNLCSGAAGPIAGFGPGACP